MTNSSPQSAVRHVTSVRTSRDDDITYLVGDWGAVEAVAARAQLSGGTTRYAVPLSDGTTSPIRIIEGRTAQFLFANWDGTGRNNLDDLPYELGGNP